MANVRVWLRESVGFVVSAVLTSALFGGPVAGLVGEVMTDLDAVVDIQPDRFASVVFDAPFDDEAVEEAEEPGAEQAGEEAAAEEAAAVEPAREAPAEPRRAERSDARAPAEAVPERGAPRTMAASRGRRTGDAVGELFDEPSNGRKRGQRARCKKEQPEIRPLSASSFAVERELVEYYTSSFARLDSLGWSGKYDEGGEKGWKISGFGCNSPLYRAGLRRGDVIQSVNGRATKNLFQVFATWKKLRKLNDFEVIVLRRGEQITLRYRLI